MKVTVSKEVTMCRDCLRVTNSSQMHDCAFTSAPHPTVWYCRERNYKLIPNEYKIADFCPFKDGEESKNESK